MRQKTSQLDMHQALCSHCCNIESRYIEIAAVVLEKEKCGAEMTKYKFVS